MYVYTAWDAVGALDLPTAIVSASDPATEAGYAAGWQAMQGQGALPNGSFAQLPPSLVTGGQPAAPLTIPAGTLTLTLPYPGAASVWRVSLTYSASLSVGNFVGNEWVQWSCIGSGGAGPFVATTAQQTFGAAAATAGSPISFLVAAPADTTALTVTGAQSAVAVGAVLTFTGGVVATFERLQ